MPSLSESELGQCWERTAPAWTQLALAVYDVCRDYQTSPAFFELLRGDILYALASAPHLPFAAATFDFASVS